MALDEVSGELTVRIIGALNLFSEHMDEADMDVYCIAFPSTNTNHMIKT
jgi:hypothetical protein